LNLYTYSHNNPISYYDPTGHFINLISGAIGAVAGFVIGAGASMISDAIKGDLKKDNWKKYVGAGAQGAIIGGVAGLTAGVGLGVVATVGLGMGAGAVGNTANQVIRNGGFNNFKAKELVVSSIASGAGFGVGKVVSSATSNLSSNIATQVKQNITAKVAQKTIQGTVQGAIVGGSAGSAGGFAANTTDQVFDLAIGKKDNFDFGSLAKDTFIGGLTGTVAGAGFGFAGSKFSDTKFGVKVSQLDNKYNAAIKNNATKFIDATKNTFSKMLVDETGSVRLGAKGNASGGVKGNKKGYIPTNDKGSPISLAKQKVKGQDIPLPDPNANGHSHTVLGGKISEETGELYRQSATFPEGTWPAANGKNVPLSEVHWGDHGQPHHHTNPHQHIFNYDWVQKMWKRGPQTPY
jgi:hypothetical protein